MRLLHIGACTALVGASACSPEPSRSAAEAGCQPGAAQELVLRPARHISVRDGNAVRALASVDPSSVWILQADSPSLAVYSLTTRSWQSVANPERLRTLTGEGGELLGANDTAVYSVSSTTGRAQPILAVHAGVEVITSVAAGEGTLWVNTSTRRGSHLMVFRRPAGRAADPLPVARVALEGPAVLHAVGPHVVATMVNYPFSVLKIDGQGRTVARAAPPITEIQARTGNASTAMLRLDCERMLQIVSDLRSERRRFILYRVGARAVVPLRSRTVDAPVGFTQSLPGERLLVGLHDVPGAREVVMFGWSWN